MGLFTILCCTGAEVSALQVGSQFANASRKTTDIIQTSIVGLALLLV